MVQSTETVRGLLIPIVNVTLLLPGSVVAEVVPYTVPAPVGETAPEWLLGMVYWREQRIPLISVDTFMTGDPVDLGRSARIAVIKALGNRSDMPYYGIVTRQIPRLITLYEQSVEEVQDAAAGLPGVAAEVLAGGELTVLPNVDQIERALYAAAREHGL